MESSSIETKIQELYLSNKDILTSLKVTKKQTANKRL